MESLSVPGTPYTLRVHEEVEGREGTVTDFAARCSGILQVAFKWAPEATKALLEVRRRYIPVKNREYSTLKQKYKQTLKVRCEIAFKSIPV